MIVSAGYSIWLKQQNKTKQNYQGKPLVFQPIISANLPIFISAMTNGWVVQIEGTRGKCPT